MANLPSLTATCRLDAARRGGRVLTLAKNAVSILNELLPLMTEEQLSSKHNHCVLPLNVAAALGAAAERLVAVLLPEPSESAAPQAAPGPAKRSRLAPLAVALFCVSLDAGLERLVLTYCSASDLARICCVGRRFSGPVALSSPVCSAVLDALQTRHQSVALGPAIALRSWSAVLAYAERVDAQAAEWSSQHLAWESPLTFTEEDEQLALGPFAKRSGTGSISEALAAITSAVLSSESPAMLDAAASAVDELAKHAPLRRPLCDAGTAVALVRVLGNGTAKGKENAAGALMKLAGNTDNKVTIAAAGAVPPLVALLENGTAKGKTQAAGALAILRG